MTLTDGHVALLARQAVDLLDPDVDVRIEPLVRVDPYRLGRGGSAWMVRPQLDRVGGAGIRLTAAMPPADALATLIDGLRDAVAASPHFWARKFPTCGEHPHAAEAVVEGDEVVVRCPETGVERARLVPERP